MTATAADSCNIAFLGDLILGEPEPDFFFDKARALLASKDLVVGHLEVPHTHKGREVAFDIPAEPHAPERLFALQRAGVHVATLAGNHVCDFGREGIVDTLATLSAAGILTCGAGEDLAEARAPARVERRGQRVGILSYNCVGPREACAAPAKAGCAYVKIVQSDTGAEVGPQTVELQATLPDATSVSDLQRAIEQLAREVHVVVVALHKGIVHTPALLAGYERPLAHAAIEAGAHIVVGHHSHILRGIEVFQGRPIFHGLGNFVTVTRALNLDNPHPARQRWAAERRKRFGFTPDPEYVNYPFHPEAKHALIADCKVNAQGHVDAGYLPCFILPSGQPEPHGRDARGQAVFEYVADISRRAGFDTQFEWQGDRVLVR
ncbi:MAG TPA: CapA family protein [Polyangiales bacterium]|nr:CapA family protein [Polyangiales bacterium]